MLGYDHEGGYILGNPAHAATHAVAADLGELVHSGQTADDGPVFHNDVPGQGCHVAHDHVVAHDAVVGNVGDEAIISTLLPMRVSLRFAHRTMDRGTFPDGHMVTDDGGGIFALVFQVLRDFTDAGTLEELTVPADGGPAGNHHMGVDDGAFTDLDMFTDDRVRANFHVGADFRTRCYDGCLMDHSRICCHCFTPPLLFIFCQCKEEIPFAGSLAVHCTFTVGNTHIAF